MFGLGTTPPVNPLEQLATEIAGGGLARPFDPSRWERTGQLTFAPAHGYFPGRRAVNVSGTGEVLQIAAARQKSERLDLWVEGHAGSSVAVTIEALDGGAWRAVMMHDWSDPSAVIADHGPNRGQLAHISLTAGTNPEGPRRIRVALSGRIYWHAIRSY